MTGRGTWFARALWAVALMAGLSLLVLVPWAAILAETGQFDVLRAAAWGGLWRHLEAGGSVSWSLIPLVLASPVVLVGVLLPAAFRAGACWAICGYTAVRVARDAPVLLALPGLAWTLAVVWPALLLDRVFEEMGGIEAWVRANRRAALMGVLLVGALIAGDILDPRLFLELPRPLMGRVDAWLAPPASGAGAPDVTAGTWHWTLAELGGGQCGFCGGRWQ